jgi:hypothetical protein
VIRRNVIAFNNIGLMADIWASGVVEENDLLENGQQFHSTPGTSVSLLWMGNFWSNRRYQTPGRYLLVDPVEDLIDRHPLLRAFMHGPGYMALSVMKAVVELNPRVKAVDEAPAQSPHNLISPAARSSVMWAVTAGLLTFLPLTFFVVAWRNVRNRA